MFGFTIAKKNLVDYIDYSDKPETIKIIEYIESLLTSDQLKKLELSGRGETFDFKRRMMISYGHMYPIFSLKDSKSKIKEIINKYEILFDKGVDFHMNEEFIRRCKYLFSLCKSS